MGDVTQILQSVGEGNSDAKDQLMSLVYDELHRLAVHKMAVESAGHTLQPTALVHEAWLRLGGDKLPNFENRAHFFSAAAEAMRRILIEHARRKDAEKRGAGAERVDLDDVDVAAKADATTLLRMNDVLEKLARDDPAPVELVKLRFFAGLTIEEAAVALGISVRTAKRYWTFARAWLYDELRREGAR